MRKPQLTSVLIESGWEIAPGWDFFKHREQGLFLSMCADDVKMERKETQSETHVGTN